MKAQCVEILINRSGTLGVLHKLDEIGKDNVITVESMIWSNNVVYGYRIFYWSKDE